MNIYLRQLEKKDAPLMLEWMHDESVVKDLRADFASKTIDDCEAFIAVAQDPTESLHLAAVDENDEYLGTVSLKHLKKDSAEFGITVRTCAMGKGVSKAAMHRILELAFDQYHLKRVYWCVDPKNARACRFYDKNGYVRCEAPEDAADYTEEERRQFLWYECRIGQFKEQEEISG